MSSVAAAWIPPRKRLIIFDFVLFLSNADALQTLSNRLRENGIRLTTQRAEAQHRDADDEQRELQQRFINSKHYILPS